MGVALTTHHHLTVRLRISGVIPLLPTLCPNDMLRGAVVFTYRHSEDEFGLAGTVAEVPFRKRELNSLLQEIFGKYSPFSFRVTVQTRLLFIFAQCESFLPQSRNDRYLSTVTFYANSTIYIGCPTRYQIRHLFNNFTTGWRTAAPCRNC
jgi:hypothetical protein